MAGINFNATEVAPNVGFAPVEKGKYPVIITKSEFMPTSNGAGKKLVIHCTVQGGANHGRNIMFNLNWENASEVAVKIGRGQFSAICHAVNVLHVQDTQQLHNIPFVLEVEVTPDGKYNEVIGIYPIAQGQAPVTQAPVQAQPVQQLPQAQPVSQPVVTQQQPVLLGYDANGQPVYGQPPQAQPVQQVYQAPTGQANPMAQYETMANPAPQAQPQQFTQPVQSNDVPDWIKNQQLAQQQAATMGNG